MKLNIINKLIAAAILLSVAFIQFACQDDVKSPTQFVNITNHTSLVAPYGGAQYTIEIESNSTWIITFEGDDISWISATPLKGNGNGMTVIKIDPNTSGTSQRELSLVVSMQNNHAILTKLPINQNAPAAAGTTMAIGELRRLAANITADQLAAMIAYAGKDITEWSDAQKADLTGNNVRERTGYVQIGYSDNLLFTPQAMTNLVGSLTTPALSNITGTGNVKVSFKAVSFKTGVSPGHTSLKENRNGDITTVKVSISGDGTISGGSETSTTVAGLNNSTFRNFSVDIDGATSATKITFTSAPTATEFSRWFIDDICVTAR